MFGRSLSIKLLMFFTVLSLGAMAAFTAYWANRYAHARESAFHSEVVLIEKSLRGSLGAAVWNFDQDAGEQALHGLIEIPSLRFAQVLVDGDDFATVSSDDNATAPPEPPETATTAEGGPVFLEEEIRLVVHAPVISAEGEKIGDLAMVFSKEALIAEIYESFRTSFMIGGLAVLLMTALSIWKLTSVTRPLSRAAQALALEEGQPEIALLGLERKDEIGQIARATKLFRENTAKLAEMQAREKATREATEAERRQMMETLQREVGDVVQRTSDGDFSARVTAEFSDEALSTLAQGVNALVVRVDAVFSDLSEMLHALAEGDLRHHISADYSGVFATLCGRANDTAERLTETFVKIQTASRETTSAIDELDGVAGSLSTRAGEQATAVREMAEKMSEIAAATHENSQNAQQIGATMDSTEDALASSDRMAKEAVEAMRHIDEFSQKIAEITAMVESIAFQTNLLALNAAVEAARSGEAGKGFAVVASEIRALAERSTAAASDINDVITSSSEAIAEGRQLVEKTGETISGVVEALANVAARTRNIAVSDEEQSAAVDDMNQVLSGVDKQTEHTAELASSSAQIAETLRQRADILDELVSAFRTRARENAARRDAA